MWAATQTQQAAWHTWSHPQKSDARVLEMERRRNADRTTRRHLDFIKQFSGDFGDSKRARSLCTSKSSNRGHRSTEVSTTSWEGGLSGRVALCPLLLRYVALAAGHHDPERRGWKPGKKWLASPRLRAGVDSYRLQTCRSHRGLLDDGSPRQSWPSNFIDGHASSQGCWPSRAQEHALEAVRSKVLRATLPADDSSPEATFR